MSVWFLLPTVLLALSVGVLIGRALERNDEESAAGNDETTTTVESTSTTEESTTTTVADATVVSTPTVSAVPTTIATTSTTRGGTGTTATTQPAAPSGCGSGSATANAKIVVNPTGSTEKPTYTYSGPVTVANKTTKTIQIDSLVVRITSRDGTVEEVPVDAAIKAVIEAGVTKDFSFSYTSTHPEKPDGISLVKFSYGAPGSSQPCASS